MNRRRGLQPWMLVSAAWVGPAVLGAIDGIAQHYIWNEGGVLDTGRILFVSIDWLLYAFLTPGVFVLAQRWPLGRGRVLTHGTLHVVAALFVGRSFSILMLR